MVEDGRSDIRLFKRKTFTTAWAWNFQGSQLKSMTAFMR
jgi:hypothetical protein